MAVLVIAGTTASGKSSLSMQIAQDYDAVIVSADAMTVYRGLDIGTAKPSRQDRKAVPHFGIDERNIDEDFDVSCFVEMVDKAIEENPHVIIAGGTTFWLSALVRPLADLPPANPEVRDALGQLDDPHRVLSEIDPETAGRLHPNDRVRVIRALEVYEVTGRTQTQLHADGPKRAPLGAHVIFMDRDDNHERIDARLNEMLDAGYVKEVQAILSAGWKPEAKPLKSFAYRHMVEHCVGDLALEEAIRRTARDTRHYAKKQRTWARNLGWTAMGLEDALNAARSAFE